MKLSKLLLATVITSCITSTNYADALKDDTPSGNTKPRKALFVAIQGYDDATKKKVIILHPVRDIKEADEMLNPKGETVAPEHYTVDNINKAVP